MAHDIVLRNARAAVRHNLPAFRSNARGGCHCIAGAYRLALQSHDQGSAGLGARLLFEEQQHGRRRFHRAAKTKPRGEWHAPRTFSGNIAKIEHYHAKATALQQQVRHLQHLFEAAKRSPWWMVFMRWQTGALTE